MNMIERLRTEIDGLYNERQELIDELDVLGTDEERSADEITARADEIASRAAEIKSSIDEKEQRLEGLEALAAQRDATPKGPQFIRKPEAPRTADDVRSMDAGALTDVLARAFDENGIDGTTALKTVKRHRKDRDWLVNLAARSTEVYAEAFGKVMTGREMFLTDEERASISVGTSTEGGILVPTHLDPTLIVTNDGTANVIRQISRVVTLTRENVWNGVTTAGSDFSWDAEQTEVSDDSPDFAGVSIPTYIGRGFIQASYEAFEDIANLASDVSMLLADGRDRLEAAAHATGNGTTAPTGIFTALDANAAVEIESTTAATIGLVDLQALKRGVPQRWRSRGVFVGNPLFMDATKALEPTNNPDVSTGNSDRLLSRPAYETDDAPSAVSTTTLDPEIVYGDFSQYVIVDKPGSATLDFIPNLFNTTTNLPDGRRAWFMRFRSGADSVNDLAFRLLLDKTSA